MKIILIVDDSQMTRNFYTSLLVSSGYQVETASNGVEGLEKVLSSQVDVVISDINMPGLDGFEMVRRIREESEFANLPILLISGENDPEEVENGKIAGATGFLVKPINPEKFLSELTLLLNR
jgi:two-component system chemotaxis response regulator CheY